MQNLVPCKQSLEWPGSCNECQTCNDWEKWLKSDKIRGFFLKNGAEIAAQMNICALNMVKNVKYFPYFHAEGWCDLDSNPVHGSARVCSLVMLPSVFLL
jgi:hypothetical protein